MSKNIYDARKPRIKVSASGQCTGAYYAGETTEYVRADLADEHKRQRDTLLVALETLVSAECEGGVLLEDALLSAHAAIAECVE